MGEPAMQRDWMLTRLWSLAMDAVAVGLIVLVLVLVLSGIYLWWRLTAKRAAGVVALGLGLTASAFFLFGLGVFVA